MGQRKTYSNGIALRPTGVTDGPVQRPSRAFLVPAFICIALFLAAFCASVSAAVVDSSGEAAASQVVVTKVTFDPVVFSSFDRGTATFELTNYATVAVPIRRVTFTDSNFRLENDPYDTVFSLGPSTSRSFTFSIIANGPEGTYYPTFYVDFLDAGSLSYKASVQVDNTPLQIVIHDKPDTFAADKKSTVSVTVVNPRKNAVRNAVIGASGSGILTEPLTVYIGDIAASKSAIVNFTITPTIETPLVFALQYENGDNVHNARLELPITFDPDKKSADPIISNLQVQVTGGVYDVTGDVTNAGLTAANSVTVTSLAPAVPKDPYKVYVVGGLNPNDFSSFEVTFTIPQNVQSIPLQVSYKDEDGNVFVSVTNVSLSVTPVSTAGSGEFPLTFILILVGIVAVIGVLMYRYWRTK